jgi:hypothetical protein
MTPSEIETVKVYEYGGIIIFVPKRKYMAGSWRRR